MDEIKRVRLKKTVRARLVIATEEETFGDLADKAGVSRNWISKVFNRHTVNCRLEYAERLAHVLGTSVQVIAVPVDDTVEFGIMLKRLRRVKGISQNGLSSAMKVHPSKLSRIENGAIRARLTLDQIELAIDALSLSKADADALVEAWAPLDLD